MRLPFDRTPRIEWGQDLWTEPGAVALATKRDKKIAKKSKALAERASAARSAEKAARQAASPPPKSERPATRTDAARPAGSADPHADGGAAPRTQPSAPAPAAAPTPAATVVRQPAGAPSKASPAAPLTPPAAATLPTAIAAAPPKTPSAPPAPAAEPKAPSGPSSAPAAPKAPSAPPQAAKAPKPAAPQATKAPKTPRAPSAPPPAAAEAPQAPPSHAAPARQAPPPTPEAPPSAPSREDTVTSDAEAPRSDALVRETLRAIAPPEPAVDSTPSIVSEASAPRDGDASEGPRGSGPPPPLADANKPVGALRAFTSLDQASVETAAEQEGEAPARPVEPAPPTAPSTPPPSHEQPQYPRGPLREGVPRMYVVQITPELAPVAKVGGLGDVVFGLSRELQLRGNTVEIILPKYDCMRYDHIWGLHVCYQDLWVPWYGGRVRCSVWYGEVHGRKCYFIEPHHQENYFNRRHFYGSNDDQLRFAFFSRAAMEFLYKSGKHPEIIHCHDWQTGLVPVFLYEIYQHLGMWHPRVVYTVHNFKHQGVTGEALLWATELGRPGYYFHGDRLGHPNNPHAINMMKAGIVYSNFVTTVSPNHAWEAKMGQGHGLEHSLHVHESKYGGVVNGVDYDEWNPEVDRYIPHRYGAQNVEEKYKNKRALRERLWLADSAKPIVAYIGRLDDQKGLDLVRHAIFYSIANNAQFVLLGSAPDPKVAHEWWQLKQHLNNNQDSHIELSFNEELSHLIYAGADLLIVPSKFEPCGLTQLVGMRYGTVPVVRAVGGLADTVFDKDYDWRPLNERNGYVFQHYNNQALETTLHRAFACYWDYPDHFRHLMLNGMRYDYSWNIPGQHYLNIYDYVRDK